MANPEMIIGKPKFSIIMPLYNKEAYVERALKSILSQSFNDWELIIVNDGSTDASFDIASKVIDRNGKCRIINQDNAGVGAARNHGVDESNGEYLCFLDADDWWEPSFLEEMSGFIELYPDAGLYASNYIYYKPGKTHVAVNHPTGYINYPKLYSEGSAMPVWTGAVCMPKTVFERYGGFPVGIKLGEDFLLWSKVAFEGKVAFLNKPLAFYNNEPPPSQRATRNVYSPESHMLFNMQWLENRVSVMENNADWVDLMDMLRVKGLMEYWLSRKYHQIAVEELKKVDWSRQPEPVIHRYKMPVWYLILKSNVMHVGSKIKGILYDTFQ